jgi:hypothetical protein
MIIDVGGGSYKTYAENTKLSTLSRELPQDVSKTFKDTYVFDLLQLTRGTPRK